MIASQRFEKIIGIVNEKGIVNTKELAQLLNVTETTIRRDCEYLGKQGELIRVHGGAKSIRQKNIFSPQDEKDMKERDEYYEEKDIVCQRAAQFVKDGDCVFLDGGTSIAPLVKYLQGKKIKIVTHSILVANEFADQNAELILLGGSYIPKYSMSAGALTLKALEQFYFDCAFIGCLGLDPEQELLFTAEPETMAVKELAMKRSVKKFLLIDPSKLFVRGFYNSVSTREFDAVICCDRAKKGFDELPDNMILE